jgi:hypothetical protein
MNGETEKKRLFEILAPVEKNQSPKTGYRVIGFSNLDHPLQKTFIFSVLP